MLLTLVTALVVLAALLAARMIEPTTENSFLVLAGVAIIAAIVYVPLRSLMLLLVNAFFGRPGADSGASFATRRATRSTETRGGRARAQR